MGAFKLYLEDLGFKTFENTGNTIGFQFMIYDTNKGKKNNINKTFNFFEGDIKNLNHWINTLNFEIKNQITEDNHLTDTLLRTYLQGNYMSV